MPFELKRNDRRPRWRVQLTANATPVDLSTASAVTFTMKQGTGTPKIEKEAMTIVDAVTGVVEYPWAAGDTDTAGDYNIEVEVDWGGGEFQSFPSKGYFTVKIEADLA
jgi:hypothetical protein